MAAEDHRIALHDVGYTYPDGDLAVFTDLSIELPEGAVSLVGQNGTGKSTLLLLAGGRILPDQGSVSILGSDSRDIADENERNQLVSFIYQNMEFETDDPVGGIMDFVCANGCHGGRDPGFVEELTEVFELQECVDRQMHRLAKGEMQRTILALSLLYGSKIIMMDEPIFAMEDHQKHRAMQYLTEYSSMNSVSIYYSVHEIELSLDYSEQVLLFYRDGRIRLGATDRMLTKENLEEAYQFPRSMLYEREHLFREMLMRRQNYNGSEANPGTGKN